MDDLYDPSTSGFLQDPYPFYARLRAEDPVHWSPTLGAWVLARWRDVHRTLTDRRFSNRNLDLSGDLSPKARSDLEATLLDGVLAFTDPPDHTHIRRLVLKVFTPRTIEAMAARVEAIVDELLDAAAERGNLDVVGDFAVPLSMTVICELLGVPRADRDQLRDWDRDIVAITDVDPSGEKRQAGAVALGEARDYFAALVADRRKRPGDDLISMLSTAEEAGARLSERQLHNFCANLFLAGHESTAAQIGNNVSALLDHPHQLASLRADWELLPIAIEELFRYEPAVQVAPVHRLALEDIQLDDKTIRAGESVRLLLGAANRDPAQFTEPDVLDVRRRNAAHLSLGTGIHVCLGASLTRTEIRTALLRLFTRFEVEVAADERRWAPSASFRSLEVLPVRVTALAP